VNVKTRSLEFGLAVFLEKKESSLLSDGVRTMWLLSSLLTDGMSGQCCLALIVRVDRFESPGCLTECQDNVVSILIVV
jgi:hypothetical protein